MTASHREAERWSAGSARWLWLAAAFLAVTTAFRVWQLHTIELVPDEAYYWDWSRHLAPGYYDQGPFIAYLIRLTTSLFGATEFGVRIGVLALSLGTLLAGWRFTVRLFSPLAGFLFVLLLGCSPLMEAGSIIATYDPPLVFFWTCVVIALERALFADSPPERNRGWALAGLATGAGFLSKHTMVLIVPCLFAAFALIPDTRRWLRRPQPYLAFALALVMYSGVFWWNAHHHWWTFGHLLFLAKASSGTPLKRLGDYLASQALLAGPVLFLGCLTVSGRMLRRKDIPAQHLFLAAMGMPVFLFFCLVSLKSKVQGNWAPCAWISLSVLFAGALAGGASRRSTTAWVQAAGGAALSLFLTAVMLMPGLRQSLGIKLAPDADISNGAVGWRETALRVQRSREEMRRQGTDPLIAGNGYQFCAEMAFYLPDHPETQDLFLHYRLTMYAVYVERLKGRLGGSALFVNDTRADSPDLNMLFKSVTWETPLDIHRRPWFSVPVRTVQLARCTGMKRYVGLTWAKGG